jgi:hypothetical protein
MTADEVNRPDFWLAEYRREPTPAGPAEIRGADRTGTGLTSAPAAHIAAWLALEDEDVATRLFAIITVSG